jgi:hypothetical protein
VDDWQKNYVEPVDWSIYRRVYAGDAGRTHAQAREYHYVHVPATHHVIRRLRISRAWGEVIQPDRSRTIGPATISDDVKQHGPARTQDSP